MGEKLVRVVWRSWRSVALVSWQLGASKLVFESPRSACLAAALLGLRPRFLEKLRPEAECFN